MHDPSFVRSGSLRVRLRKERFVNKVLEMKPPSRVGPTRTLARISPITGLAEPVRDHPEQPRDKQDGARFSRRATA
jgi:hypothetical protein